MPKMSAKVSTKQAAQRTAGQSPSTASSSDTPGVPTTASNFWTNQKDRLLVESRNSGAHWDAIAVKHFPSKTGNACRKRFERLLQRKKASEWDGPRFENLASEYFARRKDMWLPLAHALGERWQVVEAKVCLVINSDFVQF